MPIKTGFMRVRRALASFFAVTLLVALTACAAFPPPKSAVDYKKNYNFNQASRVAFAPESRKGGGALLLSDVQADRVVLSIERALDSCGYKVVDDPAEADLVLSWHVVAHEKTDVRGYDATSYYQCWRCGPSVSDVSVKRYTEGTFIVDMIDPGLNQSVWRGVIQGRLKSNPDDVGQQERFDAAAMEMFSNFPPNQD
jgi:hypothetical protein